MCIHPEGGFPAPSSLPRGAPQAAPQGGLPSGGVGGPPAFAPRGPLRSLPLTRVRLAQVEAARRYRAARLVEREERIRQLCLRASREGGPGERGYWELVYDLEEAAPSSGRLMLLELGIIPVPPQDLHGPEQVHEALWTLIEGLAAFAIFLVNTDHLADAQLYERLYYQILDEPTRHMPPGGVAGEYIDVLHPMDVEAGGHGGALHARVIAGEHPRGTRVTGHRAPPQAHAPVDRDRFLPRPLFCHDGHAEPL